MAEIPIVFEISDDEKKVFDKFIKETRSKYIRSSQEIVNEIFNRKPNLNKKLVDDKEVSEIINLLRSEVWKEFLKDEITFNAEVMKNLHTVLKTPKDILDYLVNNGILNKTGDELKNTIKQICGEYAGRVFPYLYQLSLSNTQSRRSRAGKTFEAIIYKLYELMGYEFDSQNKIGRRIFSDAGLGKKVDSILPSVEKFNKRRNKTIIGTMKTTLRERWQEVAEEIERTKIPEIHLLTADEEISENKADEMSKHNIVVVGYSWIANSERLETKKNIISFEEYFFEEIPSILKYWEE